MPPVCFGYYILVELPDSECESIARGLCGPEGANFVWKAILAAVCLSCDLVSGVLRGNLRAQQRGRAAIPKERNEKPEHKLTLPSLRG